MKTSGIIAVAAAATVSAQSSSVPSYGNRTLCASTVTSRSTVTLPVTSTYCPSCPRTNGSVTTTYSVVYQSFCPTGVTSVTYPITQVCPTACPVGPTIIPPGFTTTVATCTACPTPIVATLTVPTAQATGASVAHHWRHC